LICLGKVYKDEALSDILYTYCPVNVRPAIECKWRTVPPAELAPFIDAEISRARGLEIPGEIQPYMMKVGACSTPYAPQGMALAVPARKKSQKRTVCFYCGKLGHRWDICRSKAAGRPPKDPKAWEQYCRSKQKKEQKVWTYKCDRNS